MPAIAAIWVIMYCSYSTSRVGPDGTDRMLYDPSLTQLDNETALLFARHTQAKGLGISSQTALVFKSHEDTQPSLYAVMIAVYGRKVEVDGLEL